MGVARFPGRFSSRDGHQCYYHRLEYDFLLSPCSLLAFLPCLSLFFSPPRRRYAGIFLSFVMFRACGSYRSFLSTYDFLVAAFLISLRRLYYFPFQNKFVFIVLLFSFSVFGCGVLFSYPVCWRCTCFTHEFAISFCFW